jgi:hypothetical protein
LFQAAFANFNPHAAPAVDFRNNDRAPLLLISGGRRSRLAGVRVEANFKLYAKSQVVTAYRAFPGRTHYTLGQDGWEEVADYALTWAESNGKRQAVGSGS